MFYLLQDAFYPDTLKKKMLPVTGVIYAVAFSRLSMLVYRKETETFNRVSLLTAVSFRNSSSKDFKEDRNKTEKGQHHIRVVVRWFEKFISLILLSLLLYVSNKRTDVGMRCGLTYRICRKKSSYTVNPEGNSCICFGFKPCNNFVLTSTRVVE